MSSGADGRERRGDRGDRGDRRRVSGDGGGGEDVRLRAPRWSRWLLSRLAEPGRADDLVGDLEETHGAREARRGKAAAYVGTSADALDMAWALLRERRRHRSPRLVFSWLDVKLGLRLMLRHPGITVLSTLAMAFAIFVGAGAFELVSQVVFPKLPLPGGDRIVGVRLRDVSVSRTESQALHDLAIWREELATIEELGAFRTVQRNLITPDGRVEALAVAEMEAEGFRAAGVTPLHGRPIIEDDERLGAAAVVVIGYDVWMSRFKGDSGVLGTIVRLDGTPATIVGVMPEGFHFPVSHSLWVPAKLHRVAHAPREGPGVQVFGRLAPDASLDDARAELSVVGNAVSAAYPATHEHLRPEVLPWPRVAVGLPGSFFSVFGQVAGLASNLPLILFLVLVCGNVALLMFARAVSRESELVVRGALGASRRRIAGQLFAEALVLATIAAAVGLAFTRYGLGWALRITESIVLEGDPLPFWFHAELSPMTLFYAAVLTVLAAVVAGVLPGFKATKGLGTQLRRATAGGGGFRFGGVWTAVIVSQIAVTMIFPLLTYATRAQSEQELAEDLDLAGQEFLIGRLEMDPTVASASEDIASAGASERASGTAAGASEGIAPAGASERASGTAATAATDEARMRSLFARAVRELERRLDGEPLVAGVTFAERVPRQYHPWRQVEVDGPTAQPRDERGHRLASSAVAVNYFDVIGIRIIDGRGFQPADVSGGPPVVVVNESFVERILGGRNAIGRRIRYLASEEYRDPEQDPGPWHEIVGVVEDMGTLSGYGPQGLYHPAALGAVQPVHVVLHAGGDARALAPVLQAVAASVDPGLRIDDVITLDMVTLGQREFFAFWTTILLAVTGLALLLSLGGIFAVMSYTVSRRTREIGIRVALGSSKVRVLGTVFRRPIIQLMLGVMAGGALLLLAVSMAETTWPDIMSLLLVAAYMAATAAVCMLASVVPTMRALAVQPSEALRAE